MATNTHHHPKPADESAHPQPPHPTEHGELVKKGDDPLPMVSMILGIIALTGPGLLLGVPAIITAAIALKKDTPHRGLSLTGLITGIVSTLGSILFIVFVILAIIWGINNPDPSMRPDHSPMMRGDGTRQLFDSSRT